jgi:serine protease Do
VTPDLADSLGLDRPAGALVQDVNAKGPAAHAGLRAGDVIVGVDGNPVQDPQAFQYRFVTRGLGGSADLNLIRKGQTLKASVALIPAIEDPPRDARKLTGRHPLSGAKVANLSPAVAQELGLDEEATGVVVLEVEDKTPAQRIGVQRGDVVIGLNNVKVGSVAELAAALATSQDAWRLSLERGGRTFNLAIQG